MAGNADRKELEAKTLTELKPLAQALGIKATGVKKQDLVDAIIGGIGQARAAQGLDSAGAPAAERPDGRAAAEGAPEAQATQEAPTQSSATSPAGPQGAEAFESAPADRQGAAAAPSGDGERAPEGAAQAAAMVQGRPHPAAERAPGQGQQQGPGQSGEGARRRESRRERRERRNRDRGPKRDNEGGEGQASVREHEVIIKRGILDVLSDGYGFLRTRGFLPGDGDIYVSMSQVRRFDLRRGDDITGQVRPPKDSEKYYAILKIESVNGVDPETARKRPKFEDLTPLYPDQRLRLETKKEDITQRIIDLVAPIGKGQRGLIVSPPKAGKTTVLKQVANSITTNNPEVEMIVLLVDERPEEVTDMERSVRGTVVSSTFDQPAENHIAVAELVMERAKRHVEGGKDVVILLDSITRLARAYNLAAPASGRILSGGVDSTALYPPKRFFGAARNIEHGGSMTILATALVDTGSKMDEVIFEEFKGTGNMELRLDRKLADKRIFPAIDIEMSGTRKEELIMEAAEANLVWKLRRVLHSLEPAAALELLIDKVKTTRSNMDFLAAISKSNVQEY